MAIEWETQLAELLSELSAAQDDLLDVLTEKRRWMVAADAGQMADLEQREQKVIAALQACEQKRSGLLEQAAAQGLPADSIRSLTTSLPGGKADNLDKQVKAASHRARLLQHHSLTNWVLAQQTLLHLSQMLEIIATGGRERPTYSKRESGAATGSLVDRAA